MGASKAYGWALFASWLVSGCAVRPWRVAPGPDDGVVIVSITANSPDVLAIDGLSLERVDAGEGSLQVDLSGKPPFLWSRKTSLPVGSRDTFLLAGAVPAGDYRIKGFSGSMMTWRYGYSLPTDAALVPKDPESTPLGVFRVVRGGVHDLGRVILTRTLRGYAIGRSGIASSNAELVRRFSPESARHFEGTIQQGWIASHSAEDHVEEYARSRPAQPQNFTALSNGTTVAVGRMGAWMIRDRSGRWSVSSSPGIESLLCLVPVGARDVHSKDGLLAVAVGEFNTIAALDRKGRVHRLSPGNLPAGHIAFIEGSDDHGWTVGLVAGRAVTFYRSPMLEHGSWAAIGTEPLPSSSSLFWMWPTRAGFAYASVGGVLRVYDRSTGAFTSGQGRPAGELIRSLAYSPGVGIGVLTGSLLHPGHYFSRDDGLTWAETPSTFKVQKHPPVFTLDGQLLDMGADRFQDAAALKSTDDGGRTWEPLVETLPNFTQVVEVPNLGLFTVGSGLDDGVAFIRFSSDGGRTWRTEYSSLAVPRGEPRE